MRRAICICGAMKGCGGRLCRICRPLLQQYTVLRGESDRLGRAVSCGEKRKFRLCGYITRQGSFRDSAKLEIEGRRGKKGFETLLLTVAACSDKGLCVGDIVQAQGESYRVADVSDNGVTIARIVPIVGGAA